MASLMHDAAGLIAGPVETVSREGVLRPLAAGALLLAAEVSERPLHALFVVSSAWVLYHVWRLFRWPYHRRRGEFEINWERPGSREPRTHIKVGAVLPPYPNGWFQLALSRDVAKGAVVHVEALGLHFAVWRDHDGVSHVFDSYCPHLGAQLGVGGTVTKDNCIVCPFHGWKYDTSGKCVKIPYSDKVPDVARARTYTSTEVNGFIHVWHDAENREPHFQPFLLEEVTNGTAIFHGESDHLINAHIAEIPENGADVAHLDHLHVPFMINGLPFLEHKWKATWQPGEAPDEHLATVDLVSWISCFGFKVPGTSVPVQVVQCGPGLVMFRFHSPLGMVYMAESVTPIRPTCNRVRHAVYAEWKVPRILAKFVLWGLVIQFERDVPIWDNKRFESKPVLVRGEAISRFRRWFQKFYSESSALIANRGVAVGSDCRSAGAEW